MRKITLVLASALLVFMPALAHSQMGKIHGHIQDPVGANVTDGIVTLTTDGKTAKYTFNTDANGNYTGDNVAPDTYTLLLRRPDTPKDKILDQIDNVKITAGADTAQDDDMGRPEYVSKMTPEQRKQIEEVRKKNADVLKENSADQEPEYQSGPGPRRQQGQKLRRSRNPDVAERPRRNRMPACSGMNWAWPSPA